MPPLSPTGGSALLLSFIKSGRLVGVTSQTVIEEVLEEDKPKKLHKTREQIEQFIATSGLVVRETITLQEIEPYQHLIDHEDAHLIAGAVLTNCSHLVSLDKKHVLLEAIRTKIVSPKEMLEELVNE
jgi:predicted nucleic acid-binding protein